MWMRLKSAAGTGYYYTIRRPKSKMGLDKMTLRKYDPVGKLYLTTGGGWQSYCEDNEYFLTYVYTSI